MKDEGPFFACAFLVLALLSSLGAAIVGQPHPANAEPAVDVRIEVVWPHRVFNDVDVSASQDPTNKYHFAVHVDGIETHTTIWSHGADARTYFPTRDVPARGGEGCG